jgi:DNA-binding CsgD family transcriptional regulator
MIDVSPAGLLAFSRFFDELDELIVVVDNVGLCITTNRRLQGVVGRTSEELASTDIGGLVVPHQQLLMKAFVEWYFRNCEDLQTPQTVQFELVLAGKPSTPALFRWTMLPESHVAFVSIRLHVDASTGNHSGTAALASFPPVSSPFVVSDSTRAERRAPSTRPARAPLSLREREIMQLILDGNRVSTIASHLFLSENTVRNHLKRVYRKLGVGSLGELRETMRSNQRAS